jgi:hypothetical protein
LYRSMSKKNNIKRSFLYPSHHRISILGSSRNKDLVRNDLVFLMLPAFRVAIVKSKYPVVA